MIIRLALIRLLDVIEILLFIRIIISWFPLGRNQFTEFLYTVTEPVLAPIRRLIEQSMQGRVVMIDFSPIIAYIVIEFLKRVIATTNFF